VNRNPVPDVSVVVPCHAAARTLPRLLEGLRSQTLAPARFEILLADSGADEGVQVVERTAQGWDGAELRPLKVPLDSGPALKRNLAVEAARGPLLAFTDADCVPDPEWLERGLAAFSDSVGVVQGRTLPPAGQRPEPLTHWITVIDDHGLFETCNIFYRRELFDSLGGFSERFYRRYGVPFGEDADLGWRARRAGAGFSFEAGVVVRHPVEPIGLAAHLRAQWLARGFPQLAREMPELREALFHHRVFLSPRSARFAAAAAGVALARRAPLALLLALPYARLTARDAAGARTAALALLTDATLAAALAYGSVRARRLVI